MLEFFWALAIGISKHWAILRIMGHFSAQEGAARLSRTSWGCEPICRPHCVVERPCTQASALVTSLQVHNSNSAFFSRSWESVLTLSKLFQQQPRKCSRGLHSNLCYSIAIVEWSPFVQSKFFQAIYENYGYSLQALWVVWESIRERNYRLKKKNHLSGPNEVTTMQCSLLRMNGKIIDNI